MNDLAESAYLGGKSKHKMSKKNTKMSFTAMICICIGLVIAQGAMISATQGVGFGATSFIAAMIVAFIISQFNAMSFAELSLMFPHEGTLATYTQKAIGHFPAIVSVFAGYVVVGVLAIPVEMFLVDAMLGQLLPGVLPEKLLPFIILLVLTFTNLIGADIFSKVQNILAFILVSGLVLIGVLAVTGVSIPHPELTGTEVDWSFDGVLDGSFIGLVALAMWLMVGVEYICPMIKEVENPEKNIPKAMHLSIFLIFTIFLLFVVGASYYLDTETILGSPIPYLDYSNAVFGQSGLLIATILGIAATCSTMNTVLASVPRMLHGMAEQKQAFPQLKALNKYNVPWVAVVMLTVLISIPYFTLGIDSLIMLVIAATTSWLLAYVVAHIDVMVLRKRLPKHRRPYRSPLFPIPQVLGVIAMLYVALNNSPSPEMTQMVFLINGSILVTLSIIGALWVKLYMKRGLFTPDMN